MGLFSKKKQIPWYEMYQSGRGLREKYKLFTEDEFMQLIEKCIPMDFIFSSKKITVYEMGELLHCFETTGLLPDVNDFNKTILDRKR